MLIIDNRERHLIPLIPDCSQQALPIGDIWIGQDTSSTALIIERKTIKDLEASVLDGRYREQKGRLLAFCQERQASPMYLLEGSFSDTTGRLKAPALMKLVARLQLKHGIAVMQTADLKESAALIAALHAYWQEDPVNLAKETGTLTATAGIHVVKKANADDPKQFLLQCLMQCPGVSIRIAQALVTTYPSFSKLMAASEKELASVDASGRKVGPVIGKRLKGFLCDV
jgi:ERCC4-type nuclease